MTEFLASFALIRSCRDTFYSSYRYSCYIEPISNSFIAFALVPKDIMADACFFIFLFSIEDIQLGLITGFSPLNILISSFRRSRPSSWPNISNGIL
jgi:hypothetical protein